MKKYSALVILLLTINFLMGQNHSKSIQLTIHWDKPQYLFYSSIDAKKISFNVSGISESDFPLWQKAVENNKDIKKINFDKVKKEDGSTEGTLTFKKSPDVASFKEFLTNIGLDYFYVNKNMILTKTLIPIEEVQQKAADFVYKNYTFQKEANDSTRIEYYDFNIYHAQAKLNHMYTNDYPKYLFGGYVAKFTLLLEKVQKGREQFLLKSANE